MNQSTFSAQVANNLLTVLQGYSKTIRLLLVMLLTLTVSANAWSATWEKATSIAAGDVVLLVCESKKMELSGVNSYGSGKTYSTSPAGLYELTVEAGSSSGTFSLKNGNNYLFWNSGNSLATSTSKNTNSSWKITFNSGNLTILNAKDNTRKLQWNASSPRFACYTSSQTAVQLYKKVTAVQTVAVTGVSLNKTSLTLTVGSSETLSASVSPDNATDKTVTWTTNKSSVATVSDGKVTAVAEGSATITVTTNDGNKTATCTVTVTPKPKYTVTLNAGSGTCAASVTETSAGAGVTLPRPTLDGCDEWSFAGWKTISAVTTETTTEPTLIPAGAYSPTSDITLYAVYKRTETTSGGGGTENISNQYTFSDYTAGTQYATETHALDENVTISIQNCHLNTQLRIYSSASNNGTVISNELPGRIVSMSFNMGYKKDNLLVYGSTNGTSWTQVGSISTTTTSYKDYTLDFGETNYTYFKLDVEGTSQIRVASMSITWESTSAGGTITTTYYHSTPDCSTPTPTPTLNVVPATLTFENTTTNTSTQKTFTLTGSNLTANASLQLSGIDPEMFSLSSNSVTQSAGSINQTITVTYTPTATGSHNAILTISSTGAESKTVTLSGTGVAPAAKYTVTFNAGSGTCGTESLAEESAGAGVTLPTANPPATCATDGWKFAGWWTEEVGATTTSPGELLTADSNYKPASDCTLYAVYSHTEAGGSGSTDYVLTNIGDIAYDDIVVITMTYTDGTVYALSSSNGSSDTPPAPTVTVRDNKLSAEPADALKWNISNSSGTLTIYPNGTTAKWLYCTNSNDGVRIGTNTNKAFTIDASSGYLKNTNTNRYVGVYRTNPDWRCYDNTTGNTANQILGFYVKSSGGSTTTYNSNPVCVASWSITYDFAGGTGSHCSNTSVPQGNTYTICDDAPTKEGNTFLHWSDGTSTYAAGATFTPTGDVTLTAVWKANTYTVTWNSNGFTTSKTYNHGDELVVPTAPASCDGVKEFVGWTTHSGYYHATTAPDDIFTTKTTPVTATATYYAVFATPGAGGTEFVLGESGTFKMYANVDGTNHYAQGGVSSNKLSSTTDILTASDYTLTYADGSYTIKQGTSTIGHSSKTDLTSTASTWTISEGANGSWRITSDKDNSRALSYSAEANAFKAYATSNLTAGNETYFDIEFGSGSDAHSDYTTICQTVESIEIANYTTEFFVTDEFAFGGTVTAHFDGGGTQDVTTLAHFSGYNMNVTGTYTITVTYMGATATYEINVKPLDNAWVLTWNVSGKTNTGLGPRSVTKGSAIGTLPTPIVPDACEGKTFMGWTESNVVNSDGSGITYITKDTKPTDNTTYYAVFATVNNFCTQKPINQIASGSKVVIVAVASLTDDGGAGKAISSRVTDDTYNLQGDDVAIYDQTINTPHNTCIWTITKEGEKYVFTQEEGKYLNGAKVDSHYNLKYNDTKDTWSLTSVAGKENTYRMQSTNTAYFAEFYTGKFTLYKEANDQGEFDMQFFVTANANGEADITDYTTGCAEYTITYYGFQGGYSTSCSSDGTIVLPVNSLHTIPNCGDVVKDHTNLNRTFTGVWMTQPHGGHTFKPGDTFILTQDTTLYAQGKWKTQNDFTTLPTDVEDLAGTDIYVYGGKTLTLQPGTTTINSLTLKGGIQTDGSYQMPSVWVPEGATLVRNSNKIYLDLVVNAENWYPFAVPFETKNTSDIHYLHPDMKSAAKYSTHFDIKTYDGARRADVGEDKANNWVRLKRHTAEEPVSFKPGVGYIISAMAYPGTDTATIRIPMTVPNTWFKNGEQAVVGTTVRNTIDVTAHTGEAATEHQRHAGWNFVANPYLSNFTGGGIDATNGLDYIDGELIIQGSYEYSEETVPYVTIPAYNFAYYSQHKLSDVKLSPEWSFFVQVGTSGTMDFTTTGRQQAPASIAARAEERPVKMDVDITLSDNHSSDQTGIIISDRYNDTYEIGRDLEKLFGSAYNLSVYTLMADNTPLAFQALAIRSNMQVIPVGYRAPEQGEYTFRLNEATSSIDLLNEQYEQLVLVDYQTGELTNLLISDYTFYSERTQADNRFAIYAVPRQNAPTDLPNAIGQDKEAQKIIHNGHLYILRDGNVYNGNGQIVK